MKAISYILTFAAGALVGATVMKKAYEKIAQEEIDSIKNRYEEKYSDEKEAESAEETVNNDDLKTVYDDVIKTTGYSEQTDYSEISRKPVKKNEESKDVEKEKADTTRPYLIPPNKMSENEDYDTISYTYYKEDGIVADDCLDIVENIEETIGFESLSKFGEYEDDAVHIRNDILKCDYEVLLSYESYDSARNKYLGLGGE